METHGIEQIPSYERHGKPFYQFTLWFSSNLTVADYALGAILITLGLSWTWIWVAIIIGNIFGAFLVGYLASYGPSFGLPQMMVSKMVFGKKGNLPFSVAQWISTMGWFSVNAIISGYVLYYAYPSLPLPFFVFLSALLQIIIAAFGYDAIHRSEYVLSYILGAFFTIALLLAIFSKPSIPSFNSFNPLGFAVALATVFSYIMSWAPYASDYSRYLPDKVSRMKIILYVTIGGALASVWMEAVGMLVSIALGNYSGLPTVLLSFFGRYGAFAMVISVIMIFLGALSANVLNLYSNSLSLLAIYQKINRKNSILIGAVIGIVLAVIGGLNFIGYFESFLYFLDYWITPWIGVLAGALVTNSFSVNKRADVRLLVAYLISLLVSVPFMNLQVATSGMINFIGPLARALDGADISYFISFGLGLFLSLAFNKLKS